MNNLFNSVNNDAFTATEAVSIINKDFGTDFSESVVNCFFINKGIIAEKLDSDRYRMMVLTTCPIQNKGFVIIQECECFYPLIITHKGLLYLYNNHNELVELANREYFDADC